LSDAADKSEKLCASCRKEHPRAQMLRFVESPDKLWLWDPRERAPGRGIRVCAEPSCLKKRKLVTKEFQATLEAWVLDQIGLYMRQHRLTLGADATTKALAMGESAMVFVTQDAAERTQKNVRDAVDRVNAERGPAAEWVKKMESLGEAPERDKLRTNLKEPGRISRKSGAPREVALVFLPCTMQRLGRALGRDSVGVVAVPVGAGATLKNGSLAARAMLWAAL
jgi:predicted RNA-binding protein YlxR (DUF448 family)/peroxiredoxin family protein